MESMVPEIYSISTVEIIVVARCREDGDPLTSTVY
jgi:hypothetical protein